jgi:glycopeptide antibiotics resistance protein
LKKHLFGYLFLVYCIFLFSLTLLNFNGNFGQIGYEVILKPDNIIDKVAEHGLESIAGFILNILLFVPLGLLLPAVFPKRMGQSKWAVLAILGTTLCIETIQFFIGRTTDINDVIANFIGGFGAFSTYKLLAYIINCLKRGLRPN